MVFGAQNGKIGFNAGFLGLIKPENINKISKGLQLYNQRVAAANGQHTIFAASMKKLDPQFSKYLSNLNGAKASMGGYITYLAGATIKTVALQAASMALNMALTWGVSLAIQGLISLGTYLWKLVPTTEHLKEKLEETAQALADIKTESKSIKDELTTIQDKIVELESKGALSFTDEAELTRLKQENAQLERKLVLLDEERKRKSKEQQGTFKKTVARDYFTDGEIASRYQTTSHHDGSSSATMISEKDYIDEQFRYLKEQETKLKTATKKERDKIEKEIEKTEKYLSKEISTSQGYLDALEEAGYIYGTDAEVDKYIDWIYEFQDKYLVAVGNTSELFNSVYNRDKYSEARTAIEELGTVTAESLAQLYKDNDKVKEFVDYLLSLGTIDWKTVLGKDFNRVAGDDGIVSTAEALDWMKESGGNSAKVMGLVANELNKVEDAAEGATSNVKKFSDVFKSIKDGTDVLVDAYSDIEDGGEISLEHLMALLDAYPDLVEYVDLENGQHNITKDILKAKFEAVKQTQLAQITASKAAVNAEISEQEAILDTIAVKKEKAKEDLAATMVKNGTFKTEAEALKHINARPGYYIRGFDWDVSDAKVAIAESKKELEKLNAQEALIKNMSWKDVTSSSGGKTEKTEAEKYFDELKYNLETNKITQEQYLKDLDWGYKNFYNKTADYLEDYAKYSQEVYDGFKDMYKDDLEAQKEAWEEKKDAVSEYYDNLRKQIEDAHDEEDYEKEQSEKRKEIFDLDMKIAELMRDGSEKAKARIAELEEERLKAEEELLDFETDKAREDELSRLEKEQESEEKKIQDQIDTIDKELETIDEDIVSVRNAIINYAAKKGVTLDFAYASGTRSSVGGLGRINEKGIEMIAAPDGNGNYVNLMPNSYVFSAKATEFLWKLATEHSLPQAMYNSIAKSIQTQSSAPSVNIAQPINITMGNVIIQGNADKQTVADIKKQQENTVRMVLQKIKELQK